MTEWSATVLRNKGVPVTVAKLSEGGDLLYDTEEELLTEERWVHFTLNVLAQLETLYQGKITYNPEDGEKMVAIGPTAWQDFLRSEPFGTTRAVLSMMWNLPQDMVGRILIPHEMPQYAGALVSSYAIAEGVDPLVATAAVRDRIAVAVADQGQNSSPLAPPSLPSSDTSSTG